jgi:hypothetical protein
METIAESKIRQINENIAHIESSIIERDNVIVRVSAIFGITYQDGHAHFRLKNGGYINKLQMSKEQFNELKSEFKAKI